MSKLDDFLAPLHQGVWEVIVLKEDVTEPLGKRWVKSQFNLPSPGTIASYRNGGYHCHETESEYRVHMDIYDPAINPGMHLVDDAPLLLMIGGTVESLWVDAKNVKKMDKRQLLKEHKIAWQLSLLAGIALLTVGAAVIAVELGAADLVFAAFVVLIVPMSIMGFAAFMIIQGMRISPMNANSKRLIITGLGLIFLGILSYFFPALLVIFLLTFMLLWPISSAVISLKRTKMGKIATPDGLRKRMIIAVGSIVLAVLFVLNPQGVAGLIIFFVATIIIFMGVVSMLKALGLRSALKTFPYNEEFDEGLKEIGLNQS
jgi:uncharacterized membrane protein HdeD (DUF308 family)